MMVDDTKAISGTHGAYVPCDETALAVAGSAQDTNAVYGDDEGFVTHASVAVAEAADGTDTEAVYGQARGYVAGPCVTCDDFEEFDDSEVSGWGSNSDTVWTRTGDGDASVAGGYGRMDLFVPAEPGPTDVSRTAIFVTSPTVIKTQDTWELRTLFSIAASMVDVDGAESSSAIEFSITNGANDQAAITFSWLTTASGGSSTNSGALLQFIVDENGSNIYDSGFVSVSLDADGSSHEMRWQFTQGDTTSVYLDGTLVASGPAFAQTAPSFASTTMEVQGLLIKSGTDDGESTATILFDYFRFCEE